MLFTIRRHHRYDEKNRRIETSTTLAPNDIDRQTFAYNHYGDVVTTISESSHAEYDFGEEGTLIEKPDSRRSHHSEALATSTILTAIGSRRFPKLLAAQSGVWSVELSVTLIECCRYLNEPCHLTNHQSKSPDVGFAEVICSAFRIPIT
jgi:hypothetical protein